MTGKFSYNEFLYFKHHFPDYDVVMMNFTPKMKQWLYYFSIFQFLIYKILSCNMTRECKNTFFIVFYH